MKKIDCNTTTYDMGDGFRLEVVETDEEHEAWIYHKDYGIKALMLGVDKHLYSHYGDYCDGYFAETVRNNLDSYKELYKDEYMH